MTNRTGNRRRVAIESLYLGACALLLGFGGGTAWIYLLMVLTLPWSVALFWVFTVGWGGLWAWADESTASVVAWLLWFGAALLNVVVGRWLAPSRPATTAE